MFLRCFLNDNEVTVDIKEDDEKIDMFVESMEVDDGNIFDIFTVE